MRLPNAEVAVIAPDKLRDYLLNLDHRRGASKARGLHAMGYSQDNWSRLEANLRSQHLHQNLSKQKQQPMGFSTSSLPD